MKIKITKATPDYDVDAVVDVEDKDAQKLISKGYAVEVKADANPADELNEQIKGMLDDAVPATLKKVADEALKLVTKKVKASRPTITNIHDNVDDDPQHGFKSLGHFARDVVNATKSGRMSEQLAHWDKFVKAANPQNEATPADGGYATPVQYANSIFQDIASDSDSLMSRVFNQPIGLGNSIKLPMDNTTQLGQSGVVAAVVGEGATIPGTKAALRQQTFVLEKLGILVDVTSELLEDTNVALTPYLEGKSKYAFDWKTNDIFLNGAGSADAAVGVIGHSATVNVPHTTDGRGGIITYEDIVKMRAAFYGDRSKAVWLVSPEVEEELMLVEDGAGRNLYFPPGGLKDSPYGTLLGSPVVVSYHMQALGTSGDFVYGDWSKYIVATKGTVEAAMTPYLHFDQQLMTFRWTMRLFGQPARVAPIQAARGPKTYGNFVTLQTRTGNS